MKNLLSILYIGKSMQQDLIHIDTTCVEELKGKDPEKLYLKCCEYKGFLEDKCLLYVFRMVVIMLKMKIMKKKN